MDKNEHDSGKSRPDHKYTRIDDSNKSIPPKAKETLRNNM